MHHGAGGSSSHLLCVRVDVAGRFKVPCACRRPRLKYWMDYCQEHPDEMNKVASVQRKVRFQHNRAAGAVHGGGRPHASSALHGSPGLHTLFLSSRRDLKKPDVAALHCNLLILHAISTWHSGPCGYFFFNCTKRAVPCLLGRWTR